jgi:DMSO/TMAO reductase YedYZ molybdopterin-dependent catalytic subunit
LLLLVSIPVMFATGLLSYAAYNPNLSPLNDTTPGKGLLGFYLFSWPTRPIWLYRLTQGVHVTLGLTLVPILLFKLWSVLPKLFEWPPLRSYAHALERMSLFLLVGGAGFEFATGILNIQTWYPFPASFYALHFYGAWVFIAGFVIHVAIKFPVMIRALRSRSFVAEMRTNLARTRPEPPAAGYLAPIAPAAPTISRRGVLAFAGAGSALIALLSVGQSLGGVFRRTALLAPHNQSVTGGTAGTVGDFQINNTARNAGIIASETGEAWRLTVGSDDDQASHAPAVLSRHHLLRMEQHTAGLPIACVEGWSTDNQTWTGVRLRDLAALSGAAHPSSVLVRSLQRGGGFNRAVLSAAQIMDPDSLLALRVNGADLSPDHGYPARVIVPNNPGVHNTKWVASLTFRS